MKLGFGGVTAFWPKQIYHAKCCLEVIPGYSDVSRTCLSHLQTTSHYDRVGESSGHLLAFLHAVAQVSRGQPLKNHGKEQVEHKRGGLCVRNDKNRTSFLQEGVAESGHLLMQLVIKLKVSPSSTKVRTNQ